MSSKEVCHPISRTDSVISWAIPTSSWWLGAYFIFMFLWTWGVFSGVQRYSTSECSNNQSNDSSHSFAMVLSSPHHPSQHRFQSHRPCCSSAHLLHPSRHSMSLLFHLPRLPCPPSHTTPPRCLVAPMVLFPPNPRPSRESRPPAYPDPRFNT